MEALIAGVDEAGRGPLAGPVFAGAVILNPDQSIPGLMDSKQLSASRREVLLEAIKTKSLSWAYGRAEVAEIDQLNILQATLLAMQRAVMALGIQPNHVQVDGNHCPQLRCSVEGIIKGDQKITEISAASIVAKVLRDREMIAMDIKFPGYGFAQHKGYGTKQHLAALQKLGPSPIHRRSFAPVRHCLSTPLG